MSYHQTYWTVEKITQRLLLIEPLIINRQQQLSPFLYMALDHPNDQPMVTADIDDSDWEIIIPPAAWSAWNTNFVLRTWFTIPEDWPTDASIALVLPLSEGGSFSHPEAQVYIDGYSYAACDRHHQEIVLEPGLQDGKSHLLALHGWTGIHEIITPPFIYPCRIIQIHKPTRDFITTVRVALGSARNMDASDPIRSGLLNALDEAFRIVDLREPFGQNFYDSITKAHAILKTRIDALGSPLPVQITAAGHAHIDVAWLWTLAQTRLKVARTFTNVIRHMERFPDYKFTQSQPQLYEFIQEDMPELFEKIKQRVHEGRWEPIGGMWVEADCNITGPESLARQFLLGRNYFKEQFGPDQESPVLWLPDVFGYAWNLPQLILQAGLKYFFTTKLGWSQYNQIPFDTFWWQGLDGSRVITHFSPTPDPGSAYASTYNAAVTPENVIGSWTKFKQKELYDSSLLMVYGYGDGGGGPNREMLENLSEMKSFPGIPQVKSGKVGDFFRELEKSSSGRLPVWNGELYLEYHRGTYTTQSRNKRNNRKAEFGLHDAEFLASAACQVSDNLQYPTAEINAAWKLTCLNQFHDIIPGSSLHEVYEDSGKQYHDILESCNSLKTTALNSLAGAIAGDILLVNPTSFAQQGLALWSGKLSAGTHLETPQGQVLTTQETQSGTWIDPLFLLPFSLQGVSICGGQIANPTNELHIDKSKLENDLIRVEINQAGDIIRIFDKINQREILCPGEIANQLFAFEDRPLNWDAWDLDIFFEDKYWLADPATEIRIIEEGPLRGSLEIHRHILNSTIVQTISLTRHSPRIDFHTQIDWHEKHILLKAAFPVNILSPTATYEIQWGNVERPTHFNTSWDWARFETCAQKWVDLSEGNYGVSLLNDCKYGHDIHGQVIRVSLLRSPTLPDPVADQGMQEFSYSLLPHSGKWDKETISEAYLLNDPIIAYETHKSNPGSEKASFQFLSIEPQNMVVETIKQAEDGNGWVIRCYESQRTRGTAVLKTGFPLLQAWMSDLMENMITPLNTEENQVSFAFHPYQIITIRLTPS